MTTRVIYLDNQATTPLDPRVLDAMLPYLTEVYGNPSSLHSHGRQAAEAVHAARRQVQALIGAAHESEIVFTSGATESNHLALIGAAVANRDRGEHIVVTAIEHKSVLSTCEQLTRAGFAVASVLSVAGRPVDPAALSVPSPRSVLVSVMHANSEIGPLQPLADIAAITGTRGVLLHTDAAQSIGTISLQVDLPLVQELPDPAAVAYLKHDLGLGATNAEGGEEGGLDVLAQWW
ncbi:MAG: cysteine desulfurase family protein [Egibacteraceae bacterium]